MAASILAIYGRDFGIAPSFIFQARPVKAVSGGSGKWPIEKTKEIIKLNQ